MKSFFVRALVLVFPCLAMAQIAVLQIKVVEGEGAVHPAGGRIARPLTVEVTDDNGRPVAGAAVSFQLPPDGPGGLFSNGLRTDLVISDAAGRASLHALQLNRTGGQFRIRITAVKEQARAGAVAFQYIGETKAAVSANSQPALQPNVQPTAQPTPQPTVRSGEITPTTAKMGPASHKKWYLVAAIAVAGGAAFLGVSRATGTHGSSSPPSSVVSIGTPGITVGHP